jgi:UDP-2-acetamido-2-deoxy-ribo-hexuluronate aminotransferase
LERLGENGFRKGFYMLQMVDLKSQYAKIKTEIDTAIINVVESTMFIGGPEVKRFQESLEKYLGAKHVVPCANGTDALQIAMMAAGLKPGDEVIVPSFTYVATAEVIALLGLKPVMTDVDPKTFNITAAIVKKHLTKRTKAIVPVHLFGQCADIEGIMALAKEHNLIVIEDNAQAIGADYTFSNGEKKKAGTIGHIGCTSFFPSKNLGCYGDGGAISTNDDALAAKIRSIANHGQAARYYHEIIGVNSRLDAIQAAILNVKLPHLDEYNTARGKAAKYYDKVFSKIKALKIPARAKNSIHVFHQYTLLVKNGKRDELQKFLEEKGVPAMIYYPVPLYEQKAFAHYWKRKSGFKVTEQLCKEVISLPMHTEHSEETLLKITEAVKEFFEKS